MRTILTVNLLLRATAARILDPIGPTLYGEHTDRTAPVSISWVVFLCLNASIALLLIAAGQGAGRRGEAIAPILFWSGVVMLLLPIAGRIALPILARAERICLLMLLGEALFVQKLLYSPSNLSEYDEMLHWASAREILYHQQLFLPNSLLPISGYYPGLEILTTALANLTGLTIFPASVVVIAVTRAMFIISLFLFFEKLSHSARISALACLVYMSCSTFILFNASFAYESLALALCVVIGLLEAQIGHHRYNHRGMVLPLLLLACLAVTHHVTSIWCALYVIALVILEVLRRDDRPLRSRIGLTGGIAVSIIAAIVLWMTVRGNPIINYLMPTIERGMRSTYNALLTPSNHAPRAMFVGSNGKAQPFINRFLGIGATLLVVIGLTTGFFRSLALAAPSGTSGWARLWRVIRFQWSDSRIVLLTVGAFGFPLSVAFRLTASGWEIGNRLNTFVFIPVGLVLAVGIVHYWQSRWRAGWINVIVMSGAIGIILGGAVVIGSGSDAIRGPYRVAADAASIEPMGIDAALWAKNWLGPGKIFAADRVNDTLLETYGEQKLSSTINGGVEVSRLFFASTINNNALFTIRADKIDYLFVDLRLTTARPEFGQYYEGSEAKVSHGKPPVLSSLLKFDENIKASRIFDNGWIVIYDVRSLKYAE
jgi:hypothetical protein